MQKRYLTLPQYISASIKHFSNLLYQDLFTVDQYRLLDNGDMEIIYHVSGKRKPVLCKRVSQIINDKKLRNCFSREDILEMGIFYGRFLERSESDAVLENMES